ncbi:hypothetical protein [Streptomyces guryensis]|uniref:Uncharacterized protein n=1 Tax=Streptomyces guryensis TaxID=2886947 RepID=A0A9Q3ZCE8_9ACTN|nr:hypothetical protein [Streptomyces guryensis]MCD9879537.1 hypothetical protein [Streptomyces guryensis]
MLPAKKPTTEAASTLAVWRVRLPATGSAEGRVVGTGDDTEISQDE